MPFIAHQFTAFSSLNKPMADYLTQDEIQSFLDPALQRGLALASICSWPRAMSCCPLSSRGPQHLPVSFLSEGLYVCCSLCLNTLLPTGLPIPLQVSGRPYDSTHIIFLMYSCCKIFSKLQVYNIVIHNFLRLYSIYSHYKIMIYSLSCCTIYPYSLFYT